MTAAITRTGSLVRVDTLTRSGGVCVTCGAKIHEGSLSYTPKDRDMYDGYDHSWSGREDTVRAAVTIAVECHGSEERVEIQIDERRRQMMIEVWALRGTSILGVTHDDLGKWSAPR